MFPYLKDSVCVFFRLILIIPVFIIASIVHSQQGGNYQPPQDEEYISNDLGSFGENLIPSYVLPGFVDQDLGENLYQRYYKSFDYILDEDIEIELIYNNQLNLQYITRSEVEEIIILSSDIVSGKIFNEQNISASFIGINDNTEITKVFVNESEVEIIASNVVEFTSNISFTKGKNKIVLKGELANGNTFLKEYEVIYDDIPEELRLWYLLFNVGIGYDSNINLAPVEAFETEQLDEIYDIVERRRDALYQLGILYVNNYFNNASWHLGFFTNRFFDSENEQYFLDVFYSGLAMNFDAISTSIGVSALTTNIDETYIIITPQLYYDFDYTEGDHTGFIMGVEGTYRAMPDELSGYGFNLSGRYNFNYLLEWLRIVLFELKVGVENFGTLDSHYNFVQQTSYMQLFKTDWSLNLKLDLILKQFTDQNSAGIDLDKSKRSDRIISPSIKYNYFFSNKFDVFCEAALSINYSNKNPNDDFSFTTGIEYIY